ncbi:transforming acidic coiled-coil-containing protein 1 isoform X2 [Hypomesus transpacificus]|uniref:transforming acidic coiled-coil-containing protein 1 isoform X2 n=1 Tax=Hypomesus transpacificus TaxID=137520 RepID=UPI001F075268|nr:transforming acidic coiled-coil-containing protein 1 isoform X2 [Hypomesus transpacificus]
MGGSHSQQKRTSRDSNSSQQKINSISDSESHFETPEAETPVHSLLTVPEDLELALTIADQGHEEDEQLMIESSVGALGVPQNPAMVQLKNLLGPMKNPVDQNGPVISHPTAQASECQHPAVTSHPTAQAPECEHPAVTSHLTAPECEHPAVTSHPTAQAPECEHPAVTSHLTAPECEHPAVTSHPTARAPECEHPAVTSHPTAQAPECQHPEGDRDLDTTAPISMATDFQEDHLLTYRNSETLDSGHPNQTYFTLKVKPTKVNSPLPKIKGDLNEAPHEVKDHNKLVPEVNNLDQLDDSFNPFTSGDSKIQNSPPSCFNSSLSKLECPRSSLPTCEAGVVPGIDVEVKPCSEVELNPVISENGLGNDGASKPLPKRFLKKPLSKLPSKKQIPQTSKPTSESITVQVSELSVSQSLDDIPIQKSGYNCDPSQWDDPNFNPFGGSNKVNSPPTPPKGSYSFDPECFDESIDPFKPSKTLDNEVSSKAPHSQEKPVIHPPEEVKACPKKRKDKITTKFRNTKKNEKQSLVLDVYSEEKDGVISQVPEITYHVQYATDEEKLASNDIMTQQAESQEEKHVSENKSKANAGILDEVVLSPAMPWIRDSLEEDTCSLNKELSVSQASKGLGSKDPNKGSLSLDSMLLSEMDKAAELSQIREEIIIKEIEANQWKRKYEESRMEVMEMRKIVAEYEKTIALMIEDEQHKTMDSHKSVQQLILERDQAMADLNSVERSLSDLFRRYENMKKVLEGFKKNEEVLKKCAQEYLVRVRQEEQRYQTLKSHAEEKLDKANADIAQVRSKANAESIALNASLRKEQMKAESMERALNQKNQEIEELTKICDELIAKLGTLD